MSNRATFHEVDGHVIEVVPVVDDIFQATTVAEGRTVTLCLDSTSQADIEPPRIDLNVRLAMTEAIRQRRSGEVVPDVGSAKEWQVSLN